MRQRGLVSVVLMAVMAMSEGCSIAFQEHAPRAPVPGSATAQCSTANLFPMIDMVAGAILAAAGTAGLHYAWGRNHESYVLPSGAAVLTGTIALGSARTGYGWSAACRERGSGSQDVARR